MKILIEKYGLRKVKFWYRYLPAMLKGDAITNQRWSGERTFYDCAFLNNLSIFKIYFRHGSNFMIAFLLNAISVCMTS